MDDKERDEARLARLCLKYQDGDFQSEAEFTAEVLKGVSGWDALCGAAACRVRECANDNAL